MKYNNTERDKEIVSLFFGETRKTMQEIGDIYGVSRERIRQILEKNGINKHSRRSTGEIRKEEKEKRKIEKIKQRTLRFWNNVNKMSNNECWEWTGKKFKSGYGDFYFSFKSKRERYAHRIAWALEYGTIPEGKNVLHKCDNPSCVNVNHLYIGTYQDNIRDREERYKGIPWKYRRIKNVPRRLVNGQTG